MNMKIVAPFVLLGGLVVVAVEDHLSHSSAVFTGNPPSPTSAPTGVYEPVDAREKITWCRRDRNCTQLAKAVVYEARGESVLGRYAVAHVVVNRTKHERFPNTISEVLRQRKQFSYQLDYWKQKRPTQKDWDSAYIVGYDVLNDKVEDPSMGSVYYHKKTIKPRWAKSMEYAMSIDNHIFYRE